MIAENALQLGDVGEARHIVEDQRLVGQKGRDHQWQRRVLCARNRNGTVELVAADDANAIHAETCSCDASGIKRGRSGGAEVRIIATASSTCGLNQKSHWN